MMMKEFFVLSKVIKSVFFYMEFNNGIGLFI